MKTIVHVVGNRPQFIKLAVMVDAVSKHTSFRQYIIHTGQHSSAEMSGLFFDRLSIPLPDVQLQIEASSPDEFIGKAATQITALLSQRNSDDFVFAYGDTNTTLAAALAAKRCGKKLLHFEAGVRTNDSAMPEEINRVLCDRLADVLYCCTQNNADQLMKEGYGTSLPAAVVRSGDLMLDAFLHIAAADQNCTTTTEYVACTIHRAGNIVNRENLVQIVMALHAIHKEVEVIVPLHPHTAKRLHQFNIVPQFTVLPPLGYSEMKRFLLDAQYVVTDSGGASREAFFAKKKSVIVMQHPFWPEIAEASAALHCSPNSNSIVDAFHALPQLQPNFHQTIFGNGTAALNIAQHLNTFA